MPPGSRTRTFDTVAAGYPPTVQALARATRALVLELVPNADVQVDPAGPYVAFGYGTGYKAIVCAISFNKTGVKLALTRGASLPDPDHLLEGAGKVHRHIVIKTPADVDRAGVRKLVRAALAAWKAQA